MARIPVTVEEVILHDDNGNPVDGIVVRCGECDEEAEVYGTTEASVKRGCVMLRESCPREETNFYYCEEYD